MTGPPGGSLKPLSHKALRLLVSDLASMIERLAQEVEKLRIKRKICGGTMSADGRLARDVMLGLLKTCCKLGLSFFAYLGDRLALNGDQPRIPPLAALGRQTA